MVRVRNPEALADADERPGADTTTAIRRADLRDFETADTATQETIRDVLASPQVLRPPPKTGVTAVAATSRLPTPGVSEQAAPAPRDLMIEVADLVKRYPKRSVNAVDHISFSVARGEIFGLLGPNGAGKTTTIGILTTRVRASSGCAMIAGVDVIRDPVEAKRHFAVVPQRVNLDLALTARQNLVFHAAYFGIPRHERQLRADALLEQFGLGDRGSDKVDNYSGGMAQRLMIARALMHNPDLLFLDEPSTGLDPQARLFVWDRIKELNTQGLTVLLTTHDMDEAETASDRVAIMDHGRILELDTPEALKRLVPGASSLELSVSFPDAGELAEDSRFGTLLRALNSLPAVERVETVLPPPADLGPAPPLTSPGRNGFAASGHAGPSGQGGGPPRIRVYSDNASSLIAPAAQAAAAHGAAVHDLHLSRATLEDVFIHLTGRGLR